MILVDSSVWVDHLRATDATLAGLLDAGRVLGHPFIVGEIALGHLRNRERVLGALRDLPQATVATDQEFHYFVELHGLSGIGIGYVDAHLLAAARLTAGASFWTRDNRLYGVANRLDLAWPP